MKSLFIKNPFPTFLTLGVGLFCSFSSAFALPFKSNASAFEKYINSVTWSDGKKRVFSQLRRCDFQGIEPGSRFDIASCGSGYMMTSSPLGNQICELGGVNALKYEYDLRDKSLGWYWNTKECVKR